LATAAARNVSITSDARDLLRRLIAHAETGGRRGSLVELLVLKALADQAVGQATAANEALESAVRLAEPEGYCRTFTSEGPAMAVLLDALGEHHEAWPYLQRLRAAMRPDGRLARLSDRESRDVTTPSGSDPVVEPLSIRELEILRYLGSELAGPAIARELSVSLSTVRTHTQHIYTKLGVNNRRAAIRRAHQLGLFSRGANS
jgi:LuxR family maltose regulon positive regulatory protein